MQIAIGTYANTKGLEDGSVTSPKISFDFIEVSPITRAFRHMAVGLAYDVSEMALATYMLARTFDKPIVGLPIVLVRSSLLGSLVTLFARARGTVDTVPPIGLEPNRKAFETLARYAHAQHITPKQFGVDQLFPA